MSGRQIPGILWVGLVALSVMVLAQFALSMRFGVWTLVGAVLGALLLWGLYCGHRWAYLATVVIVPLKLIGLVAAGQAGRGLLTFAVDCLILIPVLASTRYFWGRACPDVNCGHKNRREARFCARCGTELAAGRGRLETPL
jgi:hypothetical protein